MDQNTAVIFGLAIGAIIGLWIILIPAIIAHKRGHKHKAAITFATFACLVMSIFMPAVIGWAIWFALIVWALMYQPERRNVVDH